MIITYFIFNNFIHMAQKPNTKKQQSLQFWKDLKKETTQAVFAIIFFILALLSILSAFHNDVGRNIAGPVGQYFYLIVHQLLGVGYFLLPLFLILIAVEFLRGMKKKFEIAKAVGGALFVLSTLGMIELFTRNTDGTHSAGYVGYAIATPLIKLFDIYATGALLTGLLIISFLIVFETHFTLEQLMFWRMFKKKPVDGELSADEIAKNRQSLEDEEEKLNRSIAAAAVSDDPDEGTPEADARAAGEQKQPQAPNAPRQMIKKGEPLDFTAEEENSFASYSNRYSLKDFTPPPLTLLEKDKGKPEVGDIKANANIIKRTLQNFGITVEMDEVSIGPSVTRYALKPAEGVKLSKIVGLNNDLALALAAHPIRIEAPIPGKSLVGIEIPNTTKTTVGLATLLGSDEYQGSSKPLLVSLGKGITGKSYFANLAKAPHMLIAGATGSGKSVSIHTIITSLLFRNSPESLKFIMIDPKRVELTLYNKIPHLLTPVITDPKKSILALKWAGKEMQRRYDTLEKHSVRDIESYHTNVVAPALKKARDIVDEHDGNEEAAQDEIAALNLPESMPYIVVVIDELADIMQTYPRELESAIVRLAQMSRAVGIHLILSTQRPSVNVITGLIKANVPTRIALQVASQIDSRTILDQQGAEKLLGAGDMLYQGGDMSKPARLQSAYISENELKKVVEYLKTQYKDEIMAEINFTGAPAEAGSDAVFGASFDEDDLGDEDDLFTEAKEVVLSTGKASTSFLQRKLGVGYSRAAKLLDTLEARGIVGPANGSKGREVYGGAPTPGPASEENPQI
jgi:S-DNA-T family DNA segregation ATPase FtsK/SpoIIIE